MITSLDRYLLKEIFVPFLVVTIGALLMILANTLIQYSTPIFHKEIPPSAILQLILYSTPPAINLALPISVTISAGLATARLTRENEITALRSAGLSLKRIFGPFLFFGAVISLINFYASETVSPKAQHMAKNTLRYIFAAAEALPAQSNISLQFDQGRYTLFIQTARKEGNRILMSNVLLLSRPGRDREQIVKAGTAVYEEGTLTLDQPQIWEIQGERIIEFRVNKKLSITRSLPMESFFGQPLPEEQSRHELLQTINALKARGAHSYAAEYEVEYLNRLSLPLSCLVFALFSPILAFRYARGGPFVGLLLSLIVVFLYYNLWLFTAQVLSARLNLIPPIAGAWLPNVLFCVAGVFALWQSE
ncbi:MAG: LptF/LptG family permease [Fimbriimonadales bacterium]|nr:LptF/LptG family permease [Fimbriimonadales bacterium]